MSTTASDDQNHSRDAALIALAMARDQIRPSQEKSRKIEAVGKLQGTDDLSDARQLPLADAADGIFSRIKLGPWTLLGLLVGVILGAGAFVWRLSHERPAQASTPATLADLTHQVPLSSNTDITSNAKVTPQSTTSKKANLEAPAASELPPNRNSMELQLRNVEQGVDQLKIDQTQSMRDGAANADRLKVTQDIAERTADLIAEFKAQMGRDVTNLAEQLKINQEQLVNLNAQFKANQEQLANLATQMKASQEQLDRLVEQMRRPKVLSSLPIANSTQKPSRHLPSPQPRLPTPSPANSQPSHQ